jgi:hypothetical protein
LPGLSHLFAVLIRNDRACRRASVRTEYDPIFEKAANDSGTGACGIWHLHAFAFKESIAIGGLRANSLKNTSNVTHRFAFEKSNPDRGRWKAADMGVPKASGFERRRKVDAHVRVALGICLANHSLNQYASPFHLFT